MPHKRRKERTAPMCGSKYAHEYGNIKYNSCRQIPCRGVTSNFLNRLLPQHRRITTVFFKNEQRISANNNQQKTSFRIYSTCANKQQQQLHILHYCRESKLNIILKILIMLKYFVYFHLINNVTTFTFFT